MDAPASTAGRTPKQKLQFYVSAALLISAVFSLSAFLFLIPFVLDPAYALIAAEFIKDPVTCQVTDAEYAYGVTNCSLWQSCREGCTREVTECIRIRVRYTSKLAVEQVANNTDDTVWDSEALGQGPARFFINVKGCGYPPVVNCSMFASYYGTEGEVFPCYYSTVNPLLVIPEYDLEQAHQDLVYATVFPVTIFTVGVTGLCLMYIRACRDRALGVLSLAGFNFIGFLDSLEKKPEPKGDEGEKDDEEHDAPPEEVHIAAVTVSPVAQQPVPASSAPIFPCALKYGHGSRRNQGDPKKNPASKALIASIHAPMVGIDVGGKQKKT